jgi:hypothetical protein
MNECVQVARWSCVPEGDGLEWPVVEGADQYTLTRQDYWLVVRVVKVVGVVFDYFDYFQSSTLD